MTPAALALFKKLSCKDKKWQLKIYGGQAYKYNGSSQIVACDGSGVKYVLSSPIVLGQDLRSPKAQLDSTNNQWVVTFNLDGKASKAFGTFSTQAYNAYYNASTQTQTSVLDQFAIVLDGRVVSAPTIQQPITGGSGQITGNFTQKSSTDLANVLKYGALPLSFSAPVINSVSAQLGSEQLDAGLIAAAVGLLLVVLYSVFYYRGLAIVSMFSLATAALLSWLAVIMLTKYQGYSLSLAGVAGLIVAIGITADSFIIYFERLRDEVREGRSLRAAVERGWGRARRTVLVSDTVSFLAALLLYIFAIGDVKGFAFTLGLTTLIDIVVVFLFTKPMVTLLAKTKFFSSGQPDVWTRSGSAGSQIAVAGLALRDGQASHRRCGRLGPDHPEGGVMSRLGNVGGRLYRGEVSIDFVGRKKLWYMISGAILIISLAALLLRGLHFSVDFEGGNIYKFSTPAGVSLTQPQVTNTAISAGAPTSLIVEKVGSHGWDVQTPSLRRTASSRSWTRWPRKPIGRRVRSACRRSGRVGAVRSRARPLRR